MSTAALLMFAGCETMPDRPKRPPVARTGDPRNPFEKIVAANAARSAPYIPVQIPGLAGTLPYVCLRVPTGGRLAIVGPTGAGKTYVFELLIKGGHRGQAVYTVPTRALANDKRAEWLALGWDVGIATGDVSDNLGAPVIVATLETQRHRFLEGRHPDLLVVDEYQMLADSRRGAAYETVLAIAPPSTQLLLLSGSVSNPKAVAEWLRSLGRKVTLIEEHTRPIPLEEVSLDALETREPTGIKGHVARAVIRAVLADLGPILVFAPRRRAAEQIARDIAAGLPLGNGPQLSPSQRSLAGDDLNRLLRQGVGLHHSGLTFEQRTELIEPWAKAGKLSVVASSTLTTRPCNAPSGVTRASAAAFLSLATVSAKKRLSFRSSRTAPLFSFLTSRRSFLFAARSLFGS